MSKSGASNSGSMVKSTAGGAASSPGRRPASSTDAMLSCSAYAYRAYSQLIGRIDEEYVLE